MKSLRLILIALALLMPVSVRAEAMLQYFNTSWNEIADKMPELAEAGYDSIWVPPPTKGSGGLSVGYDLWDRFDLGGKNQRGTVRTRYGTEADFLRMVEIAHRFGIRVYADNIMNHNAFDVPGFNASTPIDVYPGFVPEDFHLRLTEGGFYRKWDNTRNYNDAWQVQYLGLADLIDIAQEPGGTNMNFGLTEGSFFPKISLVRQPGEPQFYYRDPSGNYVGFGNVTQQMLDENPGAYSERIEDYLNRSARWLIDHTKIDGLRLDAVKHVRADFFGAAGAGADSSSYGYLGQVQEQFDITRGFSDGGNKRDTVFDTEKPRDDAMVFGEHLGEPPGYGDYIARGQRLVDNPLRNELNNRLGNPSAGLQGFDQPGAGGFAPEVGVMHAQSHDSDFAARRELQHAFYFTRAGLPLLYTDGNHQAETLGESGGAFPRHANTAFLGQFGDGRVPNLLKIHNDFARGYQLGRYSDADVVAYERIDKRENGGMSDGDGAVLLFMMNDNYGAGQGRNFSTSFPSTPGGSDAYLYNYSTYGGGFYKYASDIVNGSTLVPPGGYFAFSWKNPDSSDLWAPGGGSTITIYQNGAPAGKIPVVRRDGPDGDPGFNPDGLPDADPTDFAYTISVPRVTDGTNLRFVARTDGSAENILLKLDGGVPLNATNHAGGDPRDNPPALATDVFLGYEQPFFVGRIGPEKFAARDTVRCTFGSAGAETYLAGGATTNGGGNNPQDGAAATFVFHKPDVGFEGYVPDDNSLATPTQLHDTGSATVVWAKTNSVGADYLAFVYYTTDGSKPEGAAGVGQGTTKTAPMLYKPPNAPDGNNWWRGEITPTPSGQFKYKIGVFKTGQASVFPRGPAEAGRKVKMMTTFDIPSFDATAVSYRPHNDYSETRIGLSEGFHVLRARAFLKRTGLGEPVRASIYNTFTQTFYYDAARPGGEIRFPATNGETVGGSQYGLVVRADPSVTEVWYRITDGDPNNDDANTGVESGNGAWVLVGEGTPTPGVAAGDPKFTKEYRFNYVNIPATGTATIEVRLREISSAGLAGFGATDEAGHYTTLTRTVTTAGPDTTMFVAFPQSNGEVVGAGYVMKVQFSKSLADGTNEQQLKNRFLITIGSSEPGADAGVAQDRAEYSITYNGAESPYHELVYALPNLFNGLPDYLHKITVTHTRPSPAPVLTAERLVRAFPQSDPRVAITNPPEFDNDGRPFEIVLPDVPSPTPAQRQFPIRVQTGLEAQIVSIAFDPAGSGTTTPAGVQTLGNSKVWDFTWTEIKEGRHRFTATVTETGGATNSDTRNATVLFRQVLADVAGDPDDDDDGLPDSFENTPVPLPNQRPAGSTPAPKPNPETWTNGEVHEHFAAGMTRPTQPDTDGDGLPDALELGWRGPSIGGEAFSDTGYGTPLVGAGNGVFDFTDANGNGIHDAGEASEAFDDFGRDGVAGTNDAGEGDGAYQYGTNRQADTNGDGFPNFIGDLDPPFFNTLDNFGRVPDVNSQSQGGDRARQVAGTTTNPSNPDTDGDGLPDGLEDKNRNGWVEGDGEPLPLTFNPFIERKYPNGRMDPDETWTETSPLLADSDGDGLSDGYGEDVNLNGIVDAGETDPLKADTDGDGLPDGWERAHGLDPLDATGDQGSGGDPDGDTFTNAQELANGTDPRVADTGTPPPAGSVTIGPVPEDQRVTVGSVVNAKAFTDWKLDDLIVLDEFEGDGPNNQSGDIYPAGDGFDSSRDITAFYARDGGADGNFYFRVDLHDLRAFAEEANLDIYVVIDTGNPTVGEYALPDEVDTGTEMRWEAVVAVYKTNTGAVLVDTPASASSTAIGQDLASFGVVRRDQNAVNGFKKAYFDSQLDAVEFSISRQALLDAGWNGLDAKQLNYQVFTTRDGTQNNPRGLGDIGGRSDICDSIYDDFIAEDHFNSQSGIVGAKSVLRSWFSARDGQPGGKGSNDRGRRAKVISIVHGNQAIQPGSTIQALMNTGADAGYYRPLDVHEAFIAPMTLHVTPTLASAIQWASSASAPGDVRRDGPAFNSRVGALAAGGVIDLLGSTFSDHPLGYSPAGFDASNVALADTFLNDIYGSASSSVFWTPERVANGAVLTEISALGFQFTFVDQMRHIFKWFGRASALSDDGYRINEINAVKTIPISDATSSARFVNFDNGPTLPIRELLNRKARSGQQDQAITLFSDWSDFTNKVNADAYDANIRWLASRPWIQLVTPDQIANGQIDLSLPPDGTGDNWGTVNRGTGLVLANVAHDFVDHATEENYDNWWFGSAFEESLVGKRFNLRLGVQLPEGGEYGALLPAAWNAASGVSLPSLSPLAQGAAHASVFELAFHDQSNNDLSKFSTGAYIYPDIDPSKPLAGFAKIAQSQTRMAGQFARVDAWAANAGALTASVAASEDVDLDGELEYLLYNDRLFALFERIGGRMIGAWARDIDTGAVVQVAGNPLSYAGSETEEEGAANATAFRTSGFKDWFASGPNTSQYVNDFYSADPAATGIGWKLISSDGKIVKTITLGAHSTRLTANYALSGGVTSVFVRFGLSPDLYDLLRHGQANMPPLAVAGGAVNGLNKPGSQIKARAFISLGTAAHVPGAIDGGVDTLPMRNQAQTQQVEITGGNGMTFQLGFQTGATIELDSDGDGLPDNFENASGLDANDATGVNGATGDKDGDGLSNFAEFVFGTDAGKPNVFQPSVTRNANGTYTIAITSIRDRIYTIQYSNDLVSGFADAQTFSGTGGMIEWTDDGAATVTSPATAPRRFYRVKGALLVE